MLDVLPTGQVNSVSESATVEDTTAKKDKIVNDTVDILLVWKTISFCPLMRRVFKTEVPIKNTGVRCWIHHVALSVIIMNFLTDCSMQLIII